MSNATAKDIATALWRNDDRGQYMKGSCAGYHRASFFDLARIGSTDFDTVRRATAEGATPTQAQALAQSVKAMRVELNLPATNAREFRPFQPSGSDL